MRTLPAICVSVLVLSCASVIAQKSVEEIDLIVSINGNIESPIMLGVSLVYVDPSDKKKAELDLYYHPGSLTVTPEVAKIIAESDSSILKLHYNFISPDDDDRFRTYVIPLSERWLSERYVVVELYDGELPDMRQESVDFQSDVPYTYDLRFASFSAIHKKRFR